MEFLSPELGFPTVGQYVRTLRSVDHAERWWTGEGIYILLSGRRPQLAGSISSSKSPWNLSFDINLPAAANLRSPPTMLGASTLAAAAVALLAASSATARPVENPVEMFKRAGPAAGVVINKCTQTGVLALAYDDGPYKDTSALVDILDKGGVKGTFFWTGTLYGCIYGQTAAVKKAYASGHQIASHTW